MSIDARRTETVYAVIQSLFEQGRTSIRPGDVNSALRERGMPMGAWEVRAEFTRLEAADRITCDADSGNWHLTESAALKDAG